MRLSGTSVNANIADNQVDAVVSSNEGWWSGWALGGPMQQAGG